MFPKPKFPKTQHFTAYRGQSWNRNLRYKVVSGQTRTTWDMTGYTAKAEIRPAENSPHLSADLHAEVTEVEGMVSLALTEEQSAALTPGVYSWDLKTISPTGKVKYWLRGKFNIIGRTTV